MSDTLTLSITGMTCGHCVTAVRRALESVPGVEVESVSLGEAIVRFDGGHTSPEQIAQSITDEGYGVAQSP